jgi:hypothetical protein
MYMLGIGRSWKTGAFVGVALMIATVLAVRDLSRKEPPVVELPPQMMRLQGLEKDAAGVLEVPLVRYEGSDSRAKGVTLDYIGAVHIGDEAYYRDLNRRFKEYEGVLYELVADPTRIKQLNSQTASSGLGWFQKRLSELMGLSFQLEFVDYQAPNFIHADLSPAQLRAAMDARGESLLALLGKMLTVSIDPSFQRRAKELEHTADSLKGINPLLILLRCATAHEQLKIKRFMARGMLESESLIKMMEGDQGLALIHDRNKAVVEVVRREISAGKKRLAIFYGAGHLADLHKRLTTELGFGIKKVEWLPAWTIPASKDLNRPDTVSTGNGLVSLP